MHPDNTDSIRQALLDRLSQTDMAIEQATNKAAIVELDQSANGRLTRMDAMQQAAMESARLVRLENDRRKYLAAIARLEQGEYGICCRCGEDIAPDRLKHDPAAPFCLQCASEKQ